MSTPNSAVFAEENGMTVRGRTTIDKNGVYHNTLGFESSAQHSHVAKAWQDKCIHFADFRDGVKADAQSKHDESRPLSWIHLDDSLRLPDDCAFTEFGLTTWTSKYTDLPTSTVDFCRSHGYNDQLSKFINDAVQGAVQSLAARGRKAKNLLLRKRIDRSTGEEVVRMVASDRYGVADNDLMLDLLYDAFPSAHIGDALASHACDNGDDIYGNILLPDGIKDNGDSDYGVGIAFRNSEVGKYTFEISPFLFRAICCNGLIWGRRDSAIKVNKKHVGAIDIADLRNQVNRAVKVALSEGNNLLQLLNYTKDAPVPQDMVFPTIVSLSRDNGLSVDEGKAWIKGFHVEPTYNGFGIVNGLTRAAQRYSSDTRFKLEQVAAEIMAPALIADKVAVFDQWAKIIDRAHDVSPKLMEQFTRRS